MSHGTVDAAHFPHAGFGMCVRHANREDTEQKIASRPLQTHCTSISREAPPRAAAMCLNYDTTLSSSHHEGAGLTLSDTYVDVVRQVVLEAPGRASLVLVSLSCVAPLARM